MTASHELSSQLYALKPDWNDTLGEFSPKGHWWPRGEFLKFHTGASAEQRAAIVPAYDLGWLMRKLPAWVNPDGKRLRSLGLVKQNSGWVACYLEHEEVDSIFPSVAESPEDAACALLINLIKNGVL